MNSSRLAESVKELEEKYGVDFLNGKKWTIVTVVGLMGVTVGYASYTSNDILAHFGYVGGLVAIIFFLFIGLIEIILNPKTERQRPKIAS